MPGDGPLPKRSEERRRRNKPEVPVITAPSGAADRPAPEPDPSWAPMAQEWFRSLGQSGQSRFYEESDWLTARYVAEAMSRNLEQSRFSAQLFASVMAAMTELLTTEGARRRARIELEKGAPPVPNSVVQLHRYRKAVAG